MTKILTLPLVIVLFVACGGSTPTAPTKPTAVVEINSLTVTGQPWNTGNRYTINFNLIERGGVPIVIDRLGAEPFAGAQPLGSYTWNVTAVFASNRIPASANRHATNLRMEVYPPTNTTAIRATSVKISINWNDDSGHTGVATATVNVPVF